MLHITYIDNWCKQVWLSFRWPQNLRPKCWFSLIRYQCVGYHHRSPKWFRLYFNLNIIKSQYYEAPTLISSATINGEIVVVLGNRRGCQLKPPKTWALAIWKSSSDLLHSLYAIWYHPHCLTFANHNAATLATPPTFCSMHNSWDLPQ